MQYFAEYYAGRDPSGKSMYDYTPIPPQDAAPMYFYERYPHAALAANNCPCVTGKLAQARIDRAIGDEGIPESCRDFTFDNFTDRRYERALKYAQQIAGGVVWDEDDKVSKPGLILLGPPGTGKTTLAYCVFHARAEAGQSALWMNYLTLIDKVQDTYNDRFGMSSTEIIKTVATVKFLLLDDLGSKAFAGSLTKENRNEIVYKVLDYRWSKRLPTVITTNLNKQELYTHFDPRVTSRIRGLCAGAIIKGDDFRAPGDRTP